MPLQNFLRRGLLSLAGLAMMMAGTAWAGVVVSGTRVIYPGDSHEVTVHLSNQGKTPILVETWMDQGDPNIKPEDAQVPFTLSPPVFRLDPAKGQTLKMMYTQEALPQDKETVFWLNVLEVPPKDKNVAGGNVLEMAYRTRIKVFFRPAGLKGDPAKAAQQVHWKILPPTPGQDLTVQCDNPTPYAVSFNNVVLQADGRDLLPANATRGGMAKPGETGNFVMHGLKSVPAGSLTVDYQSIDDYGAMHKQAAPLNP